jgi:DNA-binding transcriptional ArsR family regulator
VSDAFVQLGLEIRPAAEGHDVGADLVLDPAGVGVRVQVKQRSLVTDDVARRLIAEHAASTVTLLVVGDRVTRTARQLLTSAGAGYYDLRGRVAIRTDRLVIDAEVEPVTERQERTNALSGPAGLEVAAALLMRPHRPAPVRELARALGRSPSTVSEVLAALRRNELVDVKNTVIDTRLFWQLADRWSGPRTALANAPTPGDPTLAGPLRLGLHDVEHEHGWALTDSAAATAYGAPLAFRSEQVLDFYVPHSSVVRRAVTLLGPVVPSAQARATVRIAPVPAVVEDRVEPRIGPLRWPLAHPLFVALDLAQDVGRGREILQAWTPDDRWPRVW